MSKIDEVRSAMVAAMKAKDKDTKETLSALLAALKNKAIDKRADLTEEEEVQVILKEIKQTKETLEMTPADRTDIIEECEKRIAVLEQYAPKMMDEAEIKEVIAAETENVIPRQRARTSRSDIIFFFIPSPPKTVRESAEVLLHRRLLP